MSDLAKELEQLDCDDACLAGTPMIPIHRDTLKRILAALRTADAEPADRYLITKHGAYYRPHAQGYTTSKQEAGRFTLEEAIAHSHPNGPDGPRDGIRYELDDAEPGGDVVERIKAAWEPVFSRYAIAVVRGDGSYPEWQNDLAIAALNATQPVPVPSSQERGYIAPPYAPKGLKYAAVDQNDLWLLRFADQDCGDQWFGGEGWTAEEARQQAIDAWNRYAPAWSVRLMRTVTLDEITAPEPQPAPVLDEEAREVVELLARPCGVFKHSLLHRRAADLITRMQAEIEAARREGYAKAVEDAWQPIETAPDDGTWVQVAKEGEYLGAAKFNPHAPYCEWGEATHWMPLPSPPALRNLGGAA